MLQSREIPEVVDRIARGQSSHQKWPLFRWSRHHPTLPRHPPHSPNNAWGLWGSACGRKSKGTTPLITWRTGRWKTTVETRPVLKGQSGWQAHRPFRPTSVLRHRKRFGRWGRGRRGSSERRCGEHMDFTQRLDIVLNQHELRWTENVQPAH